MGVHVVLYCNLNSSFSESQKGKPSKKPGGRKSKATAAKVALMKIKMKAVGDKGIPDTEKIYLQILMPVQCKERKKPMFFSKVRDCLFFQL